MHRRILAIVPLRSVAFVALLLALTLGLAAGDVRAHPEGPPFVLAWSSASPGNATSVAWGDYDDDGDLDLAVGNQGHNQLFRNDRGRLTAGPVWSSVESEDTMSVAWGDVDGDGDLDLAVGNFWDRPNRLYRNDGGMLTADAVWSSNELDSTTSVAWGDYDGDGDLDLAAGNYLQPNRLYRNDGGQLTSEAVWSSSESTATESVAWGDYDGDGDLDLAAGNVGRPNQLYRNEGDVLTASSVWSSAESDGTRSVAWGDYDGDGDLDLAAGNPNGPNRLYRNDGGTLMAAAVWSSTESDETHGVAWGDYDSDGDLDLAAANMYQPSRLYQNDGGVLTASAVWSSTESDWASSLAWGDYDGDGDLDLVLGNSASINRLYRNDGGFPAGAAVSWSAGPVRSYGMAWGDYDNDGDLDVAVANYSGRNLLHRNDGGALSESAVWSSAESDPTYSIAWGDYDGDGDLDLAVGNYDQPNRLYRNDRGVLTASAVWSSAESDRTYSIAWGDYDGDGDLDLAVGNYNQPNRLYRNDAGVLSAGSVWSSVESDCTYSIAWGDYDGDGDLDLAVGNNNQPNRLYRNDGGHLTAGAVWSSVKSDQTQSVAWGDYDGDGDLDLAVGNGSGRQPNRLYRNDGGVLTADAVWSSVESSYIYGVAWGDYDGDGDLDLATGSAHAPIRVYRNDAGELTAGAAWSSGESDSTSSVAWGDYDGDGDADLLVGNEGYQPNRLYRNQRNNAHPAAAVPTARLRQPWPPGEAVGYAAAQVWSGPALPITYTLFHPDSEPVRRVLGFYSPDGGGRWLPAVPTSDTITGDLASAPYPAAAGSNTHVYTWDLAASGLMGESDNVVFRLVAVPSLAPRPNMAAGPYQYAATAATTSPFRVRGTQVRVLQDSTPAAGAEVFRLPGGQTRGGQVMAGAAGVPFSTDGQGYLAGRGELKVGDRLVALAPIAATDTYTLYYTSAGPTLTGLIPYTVTQSGVQTLTVSSANPLLLFNLDVSLEWDARYDPQFSAQLESDIRRASELLFDWTNGQAALGRVRVYQDREQWNDAHVRVYATDRLRPSAAQGGIVSQTISDTQHAEIAYAPGQVRIGAVWNRFGNPTGSLAEDWPRTLAHELGHYAFFLDDNYLGLDAQDRLVPVEGCPSAMNDPYRDDYSEFVADGGWLPSCENTLSNRTVGRSDWDTLLRFYDGLHPTPVNAGPTVLPLDVTQVQFVGPAHPSAALPVPVFYLTEDGQRVQPGTNARAVLYRTIAAGGGAGEAWLTDMGAPVLDHVLARGAQPGDRLCVYDLPGERLGCQTVMPGVEQLALAPLAGWQPQITVSPATSRTINIGVTDLPAGLSLRAQLYPVMAPARPAITLAEAAGGYAGAFVVPEPDLPPLEGYVQVWVEEPGSRREAIVDYALGGDPGHMRGGGGHIRGGGGHMRGGGAPAMSYDGQAILYNADVHFPEGEFYTLQSAASLPDAPPWVRVIGHSYLLSASAGAPDLQASSLSFNYVGGEVPPSEEAWLHVYFWNGSMWRQLPTTLDTYQNIASAPAQGPGQYALMSTVEVPLDGPGWNVLAYPIQETRAVTQALLSITGVYTTVYSYDTRAPGDPWKMYDVTAPDWVNDLAVLEFGRGYWINVSQAVTLYLKGAGSQAPATSYNAVPNPPATYYGSVMPLGSFKPPAGQQITAWIGGQLCGQGTTRLIGGSLVYSVHVAAAGAGPLQACGAPGRGVTFAVDGTTLATSIPWDNSGAHQLPLGSLQMRLYLPMLRN